MGTGRAAGRPPKITPDALQKKIDKYFEGCEAEGVFPDDAGLKLHLQASKKKMAEYRADPELALVLEFAEDRRKSFLVRKMVNDPKVATGCMNALKQEENGGYADRSLPQAPKERKLTINLGGVGKSAGG